MTLEQQKDILEHTLDLLTKFTGKTPKGSVAPWWETSKEGTELLLEKGIEYGKELSIIISRTALIALPDHSHMAHESVLSVHTTRHISHCAHFLVPSVITCVMRILGTRSTTLLRLIRG